MIPPTVSLPPGGTDFVFEGVNLIAPLQGGFRWRADSSAIDLCGLTAAGLDVDPNSDPRPLGSGVGAGTDEFDFPLFRDGFESGDLAGWG